MGSDSIACNAKDLTKKKKTNRFAKLKQSKLDVRREQWLSQVKSKGFKLDSMGRDKSLPSLQITNEQCIAMDNFDTRSRGDNEGSRIHHSDLVSLTISQSRSISDDMKKLSGTSSCSSISSNCSHCFSESVSEEEVDDGCLDDWEAVADALSSNEDQQNPFPVSPAKPDIRIGCTDSELPSKKNPDADLLKRDIRNKAAGSRANSAWRPDDAFRPRSLPNLPNQQPSFPVKSSHWHCGHGAITWAWKNFTPQPSPSCPICYEDLDVTDWSFLPCLCGFQLCLFCHKRILEEDGRCPGCRNQYEQNGKMWFNGLRAYEF